MKIRIIFAALMLLSALNSIAHAQARLGGLDLQGYCQANFGRNVHLIGPTVNDWRCGRSSISILDACRQTYGYGARAAYDDFNNPNSWYCYR